MRTPSVFLAFFASFAVASHAADSSPAPADKIDPKCIEAALVPEKTAILAGEPIYLAFTLHNKSKSDLGVNEGDSLYYGDAGDTQSYFTFAVTDSQGHALNLLPTHGPPFTIFGMREDCKLAAGGDFTVQLFLPERVVLDKPGGYTVTVSKMVKISRPSSPQKNFLDYTGTLLTLAEKASATINVLPPDPKATGRLIDDLGEKMVAAGKETTDEQREDKSINDDWFHGGAKAEGYLCFLAKILAFHDERTIPWLLRAALTTRDFALRQEALRGICQFSSDAAFDALRTALETPTNRIVDAPMNENEAPDPKNPAPSRVDQFQATAMWALTGCKNPATIPYALSYRHDPVRMVRYWVMLMACLSMTPEDSLPILHEFVSDSDRIISREARAGLYRACLKVKPEQAIPLLRELTVDDNKEYSDGAKAALDEAQNKLENR